MSEPVALLSSEHIPPREATEVLSAIGAVMDPGDVNRARLSRGEMHVWLFRNEEELKLFEPDETELITRKLGAAPKTCVVMEVSRKPGSEWLALEVASAFAERWPCVVYDLLGEVHTAQEMAELLNSGRWVR